jgi:DNA-binding XRE family transcriptional regulator
MILAPALVVEPDPPPPDYAGMADTLQNLPELLDTARADLGLTMTEQAKQIGIALSTLSDSYGDTWNPKLTTVLAALRWLAAP